MERAVKDVANAIREAASRGRGNVPLGLVRLAEAALRPPRVDWRKQVACSVRRCVQWASGGVQHRYDRPSVRQAAVGYGVGRPIMPRLRRPVPKVLVAVDTSGSMGAQELTRAVAETVGVSKAVGAKVDLVCADAKVQGVAKVGSVEEIARSLKGGGGTLYQPVFDYAEQMRPLPDLVVFVCDGGCFDKPRPPKGIRVLWVLTGAHRAKPCDWGEFVEVDEDGEA
jgi:predicted metal-dependent peptidase